MITAIVKLQSCDPNQLPTDYLGLGDSADKWPNCNVPDCQNKAWGKNGKCYPHEFYHEIGEKRFRELMAQSNL